MGYKILHKFGNPAMEKQEIKNRLIINHQQFATYVSKLDDQSFMFSLNNEKWTAGQQLDHILRSLMPLNLILSFPKWMMKLIFSKANRPSKTYEALVAKYVQKLERGGRASKQFIPHTIETAKKEVLKNKVEQSVSKLCRLLTKYSEQEMDTLVLPHPLLGKITLREMMYFTIYHVEHHHNLTKENLNAK
jgi:hypothetical protein